MSRGWKITLIVSIVLVVLCSVACVSAYIIARYALPQTIASQPEQAAKIGHEIADYTLPPGYAEAFGFSMFGTKWVAINSEAYGGLAIMLMQFPANSRLSQEEMQRSMEQSVQQQGQFQGNDFKIVGTQEATIRGQPVTLTVSEGKSRYGTDMRQVVGVFQGKGGFVMLMVMGDPETWDQDTLDSFLASIQ
jgi:hypothetical protein